MTSKSSDQTLEGQTSRAGGAATSLGGQLRRAREARGVTLREISDNTRISMRYLEAIEADDYKHLPGGIFNRSFIKAYAKYVEFDEDEALEAYSRTAREQGEVMEEATSTLPQRSRIYMDGESSRSPLVTGLLSMVILAILSLGIYAALHWYQRRTAPPRQEESAAGTSARPPAAAPNAGAAGGGAVSGNTPPPVPAGSLQIQVRAKGEPVWIRVRADEGEQTETTLGPDEAKEFAPASRLSLKYSKSKIEALEISINGRPAKAAADPKSSLVEMVITKDGYEQFLQ